MRSASDSMLLSLQGLSVGDAFGELFFSPFMQKPLPCPLPAAPWPWTDDTHMALSVVEVLQQRGCIVQDELARAFARRFMEEPHRGYAGGAASLLYRIFCGEDWRRVAPALFCGGSYGNGGAMRAAPIGAFFKGDLQRAAHEARLSAEITHAHPEGKAGAIAVAVAAAIAAGPVPPRGAAFLREILLFVPDSITREGIKKSLSIAKENLHEAVIKLGTGRAVSAQDTVPFCVWSAAYHLDSFEGVLWQTAAGRGDCDTTCAIVGGIVAAAGGRIPQEWIERREPLPPEFRIYPDRPA